MMNFEYKRFFHWYMALFIVVFCVLPKPSILLLIGMLPLIVFGFAKGELKFKTYRENLFPIALYILYLVGIFYTDHSDRAWGYAENKLSLILLPVLFMFRPAFKLSPAPIVLGLNVGLILAGIVGLFSVNQCLSEGGRTITCLTSVNFSPIHHPTYLSIFILIAVFGNIILSRQKEKYFQLKWVLPVTILLLIMLALCLSLSALLFFLIVLSAAIFYLLYKKLNSWLFWALVVISPIIFVGILNYTPVIKDDFRYTKDSFANYIKDPVSFARSKTGYTTGNEMRMIMWAASVEEIYDHPFGVGTGNIDDHLSERLASYGQTKMAHKDEEGSIKWNPHNQYLQTTLEIGLIGGLILVLYFISLLVLGTRGKSLLLLLVSSAVMFNCLFESVYQRQSGIVLLTFVLSYLVILTHQSLNKEIVNEG